MNKRMILYIQGAILLIEAAIMVLPIAAALIYREPSGIWFFYTALAAAIVGFAAMKLAKPRSKTIYAKEGLIAVAGGLDCFVAGRRAARLRSRGRFRFISTRCSK